MDYGIKRKQANMYTEEQVRRVLQGSGISIEVELDSEYVIFCPFHNNYRTPAAEVSKETGILYCFACQISKPLVEVVMFNTHKKFFEATRFIESMSTEDDIVGLVDSILEKDSGLKPFDELMIKRLNTQAIESPRAIRYYEGRRISLESISKFSLGYSEKQDMVTIPVSSPDGKFFVGFVGRSVEGKEFKNTPGLPKSKILFNLHRAKKYDTVYVVESSFDAIRLDQNDIPSVATLGATISKKQVELLTKYFNSVIVVADNDDAGHNMQEKIVESLGHRAKIIGIPKRFKDVGDMTDQDIQELHTRISDPLLSII